MNDCEGCLEYENTPDIDCQVIERSKMAGYDSAIEIKKCLCKNCLVKMKCEEWCEGMLKKFQEYRCARDE